MKPLPKQYDHKAREKHWQEQWVQSGVYAWRDDKPRSETFVIDTPPPTVSGVLHMGHIFSYTQADFVARYQRMKGKDVFYPMGFDDNGLPTERLVEKIKGRKAAQYDSREAFVKDCREVVKDAEEEFRHLFKSAALSVDWKQEYQTISDDVQKLSQASFLDLLKKGEAYRDFRPTYWDWVDQTAIAQAEIENKELPGTQNYLLFGMADEQGNPVTPAQARVQWNENLDPGLRRDDGLPIMTTRPELLGACVAVMYHPDDPNAKKYKGKYAITPLFGVKVPMIADEAVERDKGTGLVMCCTFGDDTDKEWQRTHELPRRPILGRDGKITVITGALALGGIGFLAEADGEIEKATLTAENCLNIEKARQIYQQLYGLKSKQANTKMLELLQAEGKLLKQVQITHTVKCAERSGTPIEIIPTHQWFVKITDKKDELMAKGADCAWHPEYMRVRLNQWITGLKEDWCISRQRFFGVPFPVWYVYDFNEATALEKTGNDVFLETIMADTIELPVDPLNQLPLKLKNNRYKPINERLWHQGSWHLEDTQTGKHLLIRADKDVMDTWATSSLSPQISAGAIGAMPDDRCQMSKNTAASDIRHPTSASRYAKLFPADIRPQAHEIIRTWAFYTIVKAHLHANTIPWKNLMISGWCLAADKTKMSKSKGNVVTPVALIEEKGTDAVRYWASTSRLGADTAFSEDLLKIGKKLVTKLWNASNFAALNLDKLSGTPSSTAAQDTLAGHIAEPLDLWILSRLHQCIKKATTEFERFEYCDARVAIEDFFWNDFCDNYLELVKARAYGEFGLPARSQSGFASAEAGGNQQSALYTIYHCLNGILRLFAPFVPHITEEIYSYIFENAGSIHQRGTWPRAEDYPYDAQAELSGMAAVDVLNVIRKAKSEAGVSIKFPVAKVEVAAKGDAPAPTWKHLESVLSDLKAAGTVSEAVESKETDLPAMTEKGWFSLRVTLAKVEEQRRNAEQAPHEKLEGKVLHGPGTPDMSKHVVKVQVNSLPTTLERQK